MGTFLQAFLQADFFGKLIFFALFGLSLVCWVFLVHKIWTVKKIMRKARYFKSMIEKGKDSLLNLKMRMPFDHPYRSVFLVLKEITIKILDKNNFFSVQMEKKAQNYLSQADIEMIDSHLQATIVKERATLEKNLFILSTTAKLAPFLGLLGTVWGILITFGQLQSGHFASSNVVILGGLSTALTTTVLGLLIAIPALISYNYLKNSTHHFTIEIGAFSNELLLNVELQYRKVDLVG